MNLTTPVKELFLIGPVYARRLKKLGIETAEDLLYYFPFRYQDYSLVTPIGTMQEGEVVTIRGRIVTSQNNYTRRGFNLQKIKIDDGSGQADAIWFNRPFLVNSWRVGQSLSLAGKVERLGKRWVLKSPDCEIGTSYIHTGRLVPVYHETAGISSRWLRSRIANLLNQNLRIKEFLPVEGWLEINQALKQIHFPADLTKAQAARKRFAFEELLRLQLQVWQRKKRWQGKRLAFQFKKLPFLLDNFEKSLPFALTSAQKRVIEEIQQDLTKQQPMNRLLVGDVGSGKTVVAATAILTTAKNNLQAAIMAPTEILAQQHYETLTQLLKPWGVKIDLLTSSTHNTQPVTRNPQFDLIIGTQALLYRQHLFEKLGLLVVDEQHRFGVEQRGQLLKQAATPHLLTMTATPIPRSVALTLHGDLDLSLLDELPPCRQKIKTWVVPEKKRPAA